MSDFQFLKFKENTRDSHEGISKEELQQIANKFGIPNTDRITMDDKGNYYHEHELLNDQYLKDHNVKPSSESPPKKYY